MLPHLTPARARAMLSPSAQLVAASAERGGGVSRVAALPWGDVHWPTLVSLTAFERADAQVSALVAAAPSGRIPVEVAKTLHGMSRVASFRAAEFAEAAAMAVDAFDSIGVRPLWLKGAALAMRSAGGFGLRGMGDLDVLVSPDDLTAARSALLQVGWTGAAGDPSYAAHHHDAPLSWRGGIRLELHTGLFPPGHPFPPDAPSVWIERGELVSWGTRAVRVLPEAWHLVHAAVHWSWSHEGEVGTWQWLHDAQMLSTNVNGQFWGDVVAHARAIGAAAPVGWGLWTAGRLCGGGSIPDDVVDALRDARRADGLTEREWVLRCFRSPAASPSVRWSRYWWRRAMRGLGDATGAWPWAAGRVPSSEQDVVSGAAARSTGAAAAAVQWRRHLARVLRG